eukprot:Nk52_evm52s78 gene=Nk52_evmTU52s78
MDGEEEIPPVGTDEPQSSEQSQGADSGELKSEDTNERHGSDVDMQSEQEKNENNAEEENEGEEKNIGQKEQTKEGEEGDAVKTNDSEPVNDEATLNEIETNDEHESFKSLDQEKVNEHDSPDTQKKELADDNAANEKANTEETDHCNDKRIEGSSSVPEKRPEGRSVSNNGDAQVNEEQDTRAGKDYGEIKSHDQPSEHEVGKEDGSDEGVDEKEEKVSDFDELFGRKKKEDCPLEADEQIIYDPFPNMNKRIKNILDLEGYDMSNGFTQENETLLKKFLNAEVGPHLFGMSENTFTFTSDLKSIIHSSNGIKNFVYFSFDALEPLYPHDFGNRMNHGMVERDSLTNLKSLLQGIIVSFVSHNQSWPESMKEDFSILTHKYISNLTDCINKMTGKTEFYVPREALAVDINLALRDKNRISRSEVVLIHWTRQLKEIATMSSSQSQIDEKGPLEEIESQKIICAKLSSISEVLQSPGVVNIQNLLQRSRSSYIEAFNELSEQIQLVYHQTSEKLKYMMILKESCENFKHAQLDEFPGLMQKLIQSIRILWVNSEFFSSREALSSLLRKVNNMFINDFANRISLDDMFNGDIDNIIEQLQLCIKNILTWKSSLKSGRVTMQLEQRSKTKWTFDESSIYAQLDATIQRYRDIIDVSESAIQFERRKANIRLPLPVFGGLSGPILKTSLEDIEKEFAHFMKQLELIRPCILDIKAHRWQEKYNIFKNQMKDLDLKFQNVIISAFETAPSLSDMAFLLDAFHSLAQRDSIKNFLEKKTNMVFGKFKDDMNLCKTKFDWQKKKSNVLNAHPKFAYAAHWARSYAKQADNILETLESIPCLNKSQQMEEAKVNHRQLTFAVEEFTNKMYNEWVESLDSLFEVGEISSLQNPLIAKNTTERACLMANLDSKILLTFNQVSYWNKLKFEIPVKLNDLIFRKEELCTLRANVVLAVRDYNDIIRALSPSERQLFRERIIFVDRKFRPGLVKLNWKERTVQDHFIRECRKHSSSTHEIVVSFKNNNMLLSHYFKEVSQLKLNVPLKKNVIYSVTEFSQLQEDHIASLKFKLTKIHSDICESVDNIYEIFKADGKEVQKQWVEFVRSQDEKLEKALQECIKHSLSDLTKALLGEGPNSLTQQIVKMNLELDDKGVTLVPSLEVLEGFTAQVSHSFIDIVCDISRICHTRSFHNDATEVSELHKSVKGCVEIVSIVNGIKAGVRDIFGRITKYISLWDPYREIWEIKKDAFIRRYAKLNPPLSTFDSDINRYIEVSHNIQKEDTIANIQFIRLDCSPMKMSLVKHCNAWLSKFTNLLSQKAQAEMYSIYGLFASYSETFKRVPKNLEQFSEDVQAMENLKSSMNDISDRFDPITEIYDVLKKYEVTLTEEEEGSKNNLPGAWDEFQAAFHKKQKQIGSCKESFKNELFSAKENFQNNVEALKSKFKDQGPYEISFEHTEAFALITEFTEEADTLKKNEKEFQTGLHLFKMESPDNTELTELIADVGLMTSTWKLVEEWVNSWESWKSGKFADLETTELEEAAQIFQKRLVKLNKKAHQWGVFHGMKQRLEQFKRTMPLIQDLKNHAMRPRHWDTLMDEISVTFDPSGDDFTLDKIVALGLDQYAESIGELSAAASQELNIEEAVKAIEASWDETVLDMVEYKDGFQKLRGVDDIFVTLEDNQVTLSSMKASKFVKPFEKQVDYWERTVSLIMETTEMILQVQRQWMYLENIFKGSEDIRKQMPEETSKFDEVNSQWKVITAKLANIANVKKATTEDGLLLTLNALNDVLEKIQKSLDMYLETKRQAFPRFYFISNDDLLEILGQAKNPVAVQSHLKKCFDNINALDLTAPGSSVTNKHWEGKGMSSADGENVPFSEKVVIDGPVEMWLTSVEEEMRFTLHKCMASCLISAKKQKKDKWCSEWPGQLLITTNQILWTVDCTKALTNLKDDKKAMKTQRKKQMSLLHKLSDLVARNLTKIERLKVVALITIEVHSRDVIDTIIKSKCDDPQSFEWQKQLRFYWDKELDSCMIRQTSNSFKYGYEYLGNSGRLVITPLTDRCYMTLTTALALFKGGSPQGPAGTGKTETVKDLGKGLAVYVIVQNCSSELDYKSMGRMFSGLAQTGAWGCFDEFNRINIEVLSVVAQQVALIQQALSKHVTHFDFEGYNICLKPSCGIFITMNPGYAGRTELPDNLKSMFRPVSMMVPDTALISDIILFADGFSNTRVLAKKADTLYKLCVQQLSKQDHYDFGLRALTSVLRSAGAKKRSSKDLTDEIVLLVSMRDMNLPKMTAQDLPLFTGIISDLFPGVDSPELDHGILEKSIKEDLDNNSLQHVPNIIDKAIQLYETMNVRHGVMMVGNTGSGKTTVWKTLKNSLTAISKNFKPTEEEKECSFKAVRTFSINPKALSLGELYGVFNESTGEWSDGVLSNVMREMCNDEKPDRKWMMLDGPVDTLWIESMNTVLDDNKVLTLVNGERIALTEDVSLLFEVENLAVASPATVSRCGMIYMDYYSLGWKAYAKTWLKIRNDELSEEILDSLFMKYVQTVLDFRHRECSELVHISEMNAIQSLCIMLNTFLTQENGVIPGDDSYEKMVELWFLFSLIWSYGASLTLESRTKFDMFIREIEGQFPSKDTIYEYFVEPNDKTWRLWETQIPSSWKYNPKTPFYKIIVPTVDTVRYNYLVKSLLANECPTLVVGEVGTGKTSVLSQVLGAQDSQACSILNVNFSAKTSSNNIQSMIESRTEKRTKENYVPIGGKKLITFIDDFNMPMKDEFGSQPPLELLKQWMDYGFVYDRSKCSLKYIKGMLLVCAMGPPGGGRQVISPRIQSRFSLLNITEADETTLKSIFGVLINQKLAEFDHYIKEVGEIITQTSIDLYKEVAKVLLPTPTKMHYLFSMRDLSKVFQGLLRAPSYVCESKQTFGKLWFHECFRVYYDRLNNEKDRAWFRNTIANYLASSLELTVKKLCGETFMPTFGTFLNSEGNYQDIEDPTELKEFMESKMEEYNCEPKVIPANLVLFRLAIEHVCQIVRVLGQPQGNMLLIGVGGSGRQSLARLASYVLEYEIFQIEVTKNYRETEFHDDLKRLYWTAGVEGKCTTFVFNDAQVSQESFLEDISCVLNSGEITGLHSADELTEVREALKDAAKKEGVIESPESMFRYFIERVRNNLHICLCMSPVGQAFRDRMRMFPALVNTTTIDWFMSWPEDALLEVAKSYLEEVELPSGEIRNGVAQMFGIAHLSVVDLSREMLFEVGRHNYVTPTNYLGLVKGYMELLKEKRKELGEAAQKLRSGLFKVDETKELVQTMSVELEETKLKVTGYTKECEEYLVVLVQQKREADEQQRSVAAVSERLEVEEKEVKVIADAAQKDLDEALPALEAAEKALDALSKKDIGEVKSYGKPPAHVEMVLEAVMILLKCEPTWAEAKRQLGDNNFIKTLMNYDKDNMSDRILSRIGSKYCANPEFQPDTVGRVSHACKSLCMWVKAMEIYGRIFRQVAPKRAKLDEAVAALASKQKALQDAKDKLAEVERNLEELKRQYDEKLALKEKLRKESEELEIKLERATMVVEGLSGERMRWEATILVLEENVSFLPGDCVVASAFMSYAGPFSTNYRARLVALTWEKKIKELEIPCTPNYSFDNFLAKPTDVRQWRIDGLPADTFSTENGVIATRTDRWPLIIDPQNQANKWIRNMEESRGLKVIDLQTPNYMKTLENAIQFGTPILLQNVLEELDPSLEPILAKAIVKQGARQIIKIGDKEIDYNDAFKLYITTKLANPHYTPEISTKTTIINCAVKEQGLEDQLLGIVVRKEKPELEQQKDELVISMASGKKKLLDLEDEILYLLNNSKGSLLDDEKLVLTLQSAKSTSTEVKKQMLISEETEVKIDQAREGYRPAAQRASVLYFVLNDMASVDPMYQFSLEAYTSLFERSISKSTISFDLKERITNINEFHTYEVYKNTCRGLFEKHKLLFAFQMGVKILQSSNRLNVEEYRFFLKGGQVLDKENQPSNPCKQWLTEAAWDNITELDKLPNFHGMVTTFEQQSSAMYDWFMSSNPENEGLPSEWANKLDELQRMIVVRCLRLDRVMFGTKKYVTNNLGARYAEPPSQDLNLVYKDSTNSIPIVFVLSPGVDPTKRLVELAEMNGMSDGKFLYLSLGQGQAPIAERMIEDGVKRGCWVFLANCHLSLSWMPALDKIVANIQDPTSQVHSDFRLFLSSSPNPDFPIAILQSSIKITTEPPQGLKANMSRLYATLSEEKISQNAREANLKRLVFALTFFHSLLLERRKFMTLGWNVPYDFNDSDFEICENLTMKYLDSAEDIPWEALKYLIAEANYGGRVTDDWDRRVLRSYMDRMYCNEALETPHYPLTVTKEYHIPDDGPLQSYRDFIATWPAQDCPEAFGQHANADVSSQIRESSSLLSTLLALQPREKASSQGGSGEDDSLLTISDIGQKMPDLPDEELAVKILRDEPTPLNTVLLQEIQRYNILLTTIKTSLVQLEKGIKGLVVMSSDLEETFNCINTGKIPPQWGKAYPSLKPLAAWTRELIDRVDQLNNWLISGQPKVFWLTGFTFPTGFLTAILQTYARAQSVPIDSLVWEFPIVSLDEKNITQEPKDGCYIKGLFLEGAGWDKKGGCLTEPTSMQLIVSMPIIHFKPYLAEKKKSQKGVYQCPCYMYPIRSTSFIIAIDLKSGASDSDHWIKRGTALLLSLET